MEKYKLSNSQSSTSIASETMILNHEKGEYYSLDETGSLVWQELQKSAQSFEQLVKIIIENYDISEEDCQTDVKELLDNLQNEGLVEKIEED